jgi:hypothetical protein
MEGQEKIWVDGMVFKKKPFPKVGHKIALWVPNVDELCAWLQAHKKANNSINIDILGSKEPRFDEKGNEKLSASLDTWVPQAPPQQAGFGGHPQQPMQQPQAPQGYDQSMQPPPAPQQYQQPPAPAPQQYQQPQQPYQQ